MLDNKLVPPYSGGTLQTDGYHLNLFIFRYLHNVKESINVNLPVEEVFYAHSSEEQWDISLDPIVVTIPPVVISMVLVFILDLFIRTRIGVNLNTTCPPGTLFHFYSPASLPPVMIVVHLCGQIRHLCVVKVVIAVVKAAVIASISAWVTG
ncbi:unnamed protein product [Linum trigynum]|uniref:Uncharacterized protein n=1 Tax=Linum trigynum TaxID=586398 RepID=A0AAV2GL62_9ROSI